jgi:hypothetical protein
MNLMLILVSLYVLFHAWREKVAVQHRVGYGCFFLREI